MRVCAEKESVICRNDIFWLFAYHKGISWYQYLVRSSAKEIFDAKKCEREKMENRHVSNLAIYVHRIEAHFRWRIFCTFTTDRQIHSSNEFRMYDFFTLPLSLSHKHRKKPICTIPMYILYFIILYVCFVREHLYIRRKKSMNSAQKHLAFFSLPASRSSLRSSMAAAAVKRMNESEAKKKRIGTPETHKNIYCMRGLQIFLLCRSRLYKNRFLIKNNSSDFYQYRKHIKITETNQRSPTKMWMSKNETKHTLLSVRSRTQIRNKQILDNIYK